MDGMMIEGEVVADRVLWRDIIQLYLFIQLFTLLCLMLQLIKEND